MVKFTQEGRPKGGERADEVVARTTYASRMVRLLKDAQTNQARR